MAVIEQLALPGGWITLTEAAKIAEARPEAIRTYFRLHSLPVKRVGNSVVLLQRDVEQYKLNKRS